MSGMRWSDLAVIVIPLFIAILVYVFVNGMKKPRPSSPLRPSHAPPSLPTVTIAANDILVDSKWTLLPEARPIIESLAKRTSLYVIAVVRSFAEMRSARELLGRELDGVIPDDQILFCQTALGRASMARQLEVHLHLDFDPEAVRQVAIFHSAVLIAARGVSAPGAACTCESLEQFTNSRMRSLFPALAAEGVKHP
jgi:hypothetical protein